MASEESAMREFASSGPAFAQLEAFGPIDWAMWGAAADRLARDLAGAADLDRRIHHLYLPVLFFCLARRSRHDASRPLLVGMQAPQGAGKTTLVTSLLALLPDLGLRGAGVSIDDFYLTRAEQLELAAANPGNPYLEHRGYPGTHDVGLGAATLAAFTHLGPASAGGSGARVPVYDKSQHGGRGDRAPANAWRTVSGPLDIALVEGWMFGFSPVPESRLTDPLLAQPNRALADYERWYRHLDAFVLLRATDPQFVVKWRIEAEEKMVASGKPGLDRAAIEDYVRRFLPAYALYAGRAPERFKPDETFQVFLDEQRRPVGKP